MIPLLLKNIPFFKKSYAEKFSLRVSNNKRRRAIWLRKVLIPLSVICAHLLFTLNKISLQEFENSHAKSIIQRKYHTHQISGQFLLIQWDFSKFQAQKLQDLDWRFVYNYSVSNFSLKFENFLYLFKYTRISELLFHSCFLIFPEISLVIFYNASSAVETLDHLFSYYKSFSSK